MINLWYIQIPWSNKHLHKSKKEINKQKKFNLTNKEPKFYLILKKYKPNNKNKTYEFIIKIMSN